MSLLHWVRSAIQKKRELDEALDKNIAQSFTFRQRIISPETADYLEDFTDIFERRKRHNGHGH